MRKLSISMFAVLAVFISCEEWEPVFTFNYDEPEINQYSYPEANTTIAELKAMYSSSPVSLTGDIVIAGQVISSDESGNIYKSLYIQDDTGAIELKIGKSGLYNDYKLGQWIYVDCAGLTLGDYNGMLQLGYVDPTGDYETAYMDVQLIIDTHVYKGEMGDPIEPTEVTAEEIAAALKAGGHKSDLFGECVTMRGLTYGASSSYSSDSYKRIFALLYIDQSKDKTLSTNRVFLSDKTYNVTTWAMSKNAFISKLDAGDFDDAETGDGVSILTTRSGETRTIKETMRDNAVAVTVSQYFTFGSSAVQIRTSGYSKFADTEIDESVLGDISASYADGASIDVTGILTIYNGSAQLTLLDLSGITVND